MQGRNIKDMDEDENESAGKGKGNAQNVARIMAYAGYGVNLQTVAAGMPKLALRRRRLLN
jgi:hypothetical protein